MAAQDGDVIEMTVIHDNDISGVQLNRYQYQLSTAVPVSDAGLLSDVSLIIEALYNIVKNMIAIRNVFREVRVVNKTQDLLIGSTSAGTYNGGTSAGNDLPQGTTAFIYFTTDVPRVILSKYLPSSTVGDSAAGGNLTSAAMALVVAMGVELLAPKDLPPNTYQYGYFSPKTASFVLPQIATVSSPFAYQRRRKVGRGA